MRVSLPANLDHLERPGGLLQGQIDSAAWFGAELLSMSAASVARYLARAKGQRHHRWRLDNPLLWPVNGLDRTVPASRLQLRARALLQRWRVTGRSVATTGTVMT